VNSLTSIYGGFVVFSVLGFMARKSHTDMKNVVRSGITLAYVSFPSAIADMPGSTFWAVLFYVMVLLLGLDTQFTVVEICVTAILDAFPKKLNPAKHQQILTAGLCIVFFLLGLPLMTGCGVYWIILMDDFAGSWGLIFIAIIEGKFYWVHCTVSMLWSEKLRWETDLVKLYLQIYFSDICRMDLWR